MSIGESCGLDTVSNSNSKSEKGANISANIKDGSFEFTRSQLSRLFGERFQMNDSSKMKNVEKFKSSSKCCLGNKLKIINLEEVSWHDTLNDCWLVIYDYVFNCTKFLEKHPGGLDMLLEYAGRDATLAFVGTGHSSAAFKILENFIIGELPSGERIFRISSSVSAISD